MDSRRHVEAHVKRTYKPERPVHAPTIDLPTHGAMADSGEYISNSKYPSGMKFEGRVTKGGSMSKSKKSNTKSRAVTRGLRTPVKSSGAESNEYPSGMDSEGVVAQGGSMSKSKSKKSNTKSRGAPVESSEAKFGAQYRRSERHQKVTASIDPVFVLNEVRGAATTNKLSKELESINFVPKRNYGDDENPPLGDILDGSEIFQAEGPERPDEARMNKGGYADSYLRMGHDQVKKPAPRSMPAPPPPPPLGTTQRNVRSGPRVSAPPPTDLLDQIRSRRVDTPDDDVDVAEMNTEQQTAHGHLLRAFSTDERQLSDDSTSSQDPSEFTETNSRANRDNSNIFGGLSAPPEILARGPRARRAYTEAARDGTKKVFRTRLMLVGQERVGKTSLKKSLTGQGFDKHEAITDGVETTDACEINIQIAKTSGKVWSIHKATPTQDDTKDDEYTKALADEIAKRLMISTPKEVPSEPPPTTDDTDGHSTGTSHEEHLMSPPTSAEITVPAQITSLVEKMLLKQVHQKADKHAGEGDGGAEGEVTLSIWDFAGHDVYYTTHQVFLTWRAVYIIVFDLSRDLDSVVPPDSRDALYETAKGNSKSELTCLQFINFWLCSIFAHAVAPSSVSNKKGCSKTHQKSPPIFIVGTHRESVPGDAVHKKKKIDEAFNNIRKNIKRKPYECHVIPQYYAIENSLGDTDEELVSLREHIERVAVEEPYMGEEIPLRWLLFEEALAAGQINFMTLDQTKDLTRPVGMATERELLTMLTFYHDLGYIVYFGDLEDDQSLLRDIVILNPQWLINVFKQVITILDPSKRDGIVSDAWTRLEDEGILEDRLIQHMWQGCLEQKGALVEMMAKFDLICEAPAVRTHQSSMSEDEVLEPHVGEGEHVTCFYVPSRLTPRCSNEEIGQIKSSLDFYVDFRGFLPEGLFHRLMARAVRWMNEREGDPVFLFYRQISLMPDGEHQALFDMLPPHESTIKVTVFRSEVADLDDDDDDYDHDDKPPDPEVVNQVMTFMTDTLSSLRRRWAKRIQYDVCFACPKCKKRKPLKDCLTKKSLRCGLHAINAVSVRSKFGIDPPGAHSEAESPQMCRKRKKILCPLYLNDLAGKIGKEWQQLGIRLGLSQADIDHVVENKLHATDRIFAMLSMWHQRKSAKGDQQKPIEELCRALRGCDRTDLSDCIQSEAGID